MNDPDHDIPDRPISVVVRQKRYGSLNTDIEEGTDQVGGSQDPADRGAADPAAAQCCEENAKEIKELTETVTNLTETVNTLTETVNNLQTMIDDSTVTAECNDDGTITISITWGTPPGAEGGDGGEGGV